MLQKLKEALAIFISNIGLISLIVLTIWLPASLLLEYVNIAAPLRNEFAEYMREIRISNFIELAFEPIYIGALIYSLSQIKQGRIAKYSQAMSVGLRSWGKLFAVRFWVRLFVLLGLIAFIVPGIVIAMRYAFIGCVVVLEESLPRRAMLRSVSLTKGKRWQIFGAASLGWLVILIFIAVFILLGVIMLALLGQEENIVMSVLMSCVIKISTVILDIVIFLFYWEARQKELIDDRVET